MVRTFRNKKESVDKRTVGFCKKKARTRNASIEHIKEAFTHNADRTQYHRVTTARLLSHFCKLILPKIASRFTSCLRYENPSHQLPSHSTR